LNNKLIAVLVIYIFVQAVKLFLKALNQQHLAKHGAEVPTGFEEHIDTEVLIRMRDYTVAHDRVEHVASLIGVGITIIFLFGGLLNWYNNFIDSMQWPPVLAGTIFFLLLAYADTVINIPFSLYNTFSVEKRFGFTTQTLSLWGVDLLKSLAVNTILLGLLFAALLWLIQEMPGYWWLAGWFFVLGFSVFLLYVSPYVIEPLFNKFTPIQDDLLEKRIKETMGKAGLSISRVFTMDASKRSKHSNAYFTGIGHVKRIVLFDTLLNNHQPEEILAILAHEAGHWKKKHLLKMLILSQAITLAGLFFAYQLTTSDQIALLFQLDIPTMPAKLLLIAFLGGLLLFPIKPLFALLSRKHERQADRFAVQLIQETKPMAESLIRLSRDNLANLHPHPWFAAFNYSHPPVVSRVAEIKSYNPKKLLASNTDDRN
jgi:STE24 endopeptidase